MFIMFIFYLMVLFKRCVILKTLDTRGILSTPVSDVHDRLKLKQTTQPLNLQERLLTVNEINIIQ